MANKNSSNNVKPNSATPKGAKPLNLNRLAALPPNVATALTTAYNAAYRLYAPKGATITVAYKLGKVYAKGLPGKPLSATRIKRSLARAGLGNALVTYKPSRNRVTVVLNAAYAKPTRGSVALNPKAATASVSSNRAPSPVKPGS